MVSIGAATGVVVERGAGLCEVLLKGLLEVCAVVNFASAEPCLSCT